VSTLIRRWRTAFGFLLLFLLWEVGVHVFAVHEYILPPPRTLERARTGRPPAVSLTELAQATKIIDQAYRRMG
jgi:ABC-type nitrate/sulfonate/bicarbonate transport system permease component